MPRRTAHCGCIPLLLLEYGNHISTFLAFSASGAASAGLGRKESLAWGLLLIILHGLEAAVTPCVRDRSRAFRICLALHKQPRKENRGLLFLQGDTILPITCFNIVVRVKTRTIQGIRKCKGQCHPIQGIEKLTVTTRMKLGSTGRGIVAWSSRRWGTRGKNDEGDMGNDMLINQCVQLSKCELRPYTRHVTLYTAP